MSAAAERAVGTPRSLSPAVLVTGKGAPLSGAESVFGVPPWWQ